MRPRRHPASLLVATLLVAILAASTHAAFAHEPVDHRLILDGKPASVAISERGLSSMPPAIATNDAELDELWDRFGFTLSDIGIPDGQGGLTSPPVPPPPPVAFGREVAVFQVEEGRLVGVERDGRRLIVRFDSYPLGVQNTGPPRMDVQIVGVARSGLPPSPFTLVQENDGEVAYQVQVDLGPDAHTLPRTGTSARALLLLAAVLATSGLAVRRLVFSGPRTRS